MAMNKSSITVIAAASLAAATLHAQDRADAGAQTPKAPGPVITLSGNMSGDAVMKGDDKKYGDLSSTGFNLDIAYPIQIGSSILTVGAGYGETILDTKGDMPVPENLRSLSMNAMLITPLTDKWSLVAFAAPYINTAGNGIEGDGFGVSVAVAGSYQFNENLKASFGIGYDSLYNGDGIILPMGGIEWIISPEWSLDIGYPETALNYSFNEKLTFSLVADGQVASYYVTPDSMPNNALGAKLGDTVVNYKDIRAGLRAKYSLCSYMEISASAGWVFRREFDYDEADYTIKSDEGAPYCNLSLKMNF
jgi:hypothetical protein